MMFGQYMQPYLPVVVSADGTVAVDIDGAPWIFVGEEPDVWDEAGERWRSSRMVMEGADAEAVEAAEEAARWVGQLSAVGQALIGYADQIESSSAADDSEFLCRLFELIGRKVP